MQDWRADVDRWWAGVLGVPVAAVRSGGVYALDHVDHVGVVTVEGAAAQVVYGPAPVLPVLHAAVDASGDLADGRHLAALLAPQAGRVLGPAWYGYGTAQSLGSPPGQAVRPLREADLPLLQLCMSGHRRPSGKRAVPRDCQRSASLTTATCWP